MTRISVAILTRNRSKSLMKLLLSISCQARLPEEVIVVDDGDDDKNEMLVRENYESF